MFGQRKHRDASDKTFKNIPIDEESFQFSNIKNLTTLKAKNWSELYDEFSTIHDNINSAIKNKEPHNYTTDKKFFKHFEKLKKYKNLTPDNVSRSNHTDHSLEIKEDFEGFKKKKIEGEIKKIDKYFDKKLLERDNPLDTYKDRIEVGDKGVIYSGAIHTIDYPADKLKARMDKIVEEYRQLYKP
eukprot:gene12736-6928_t